jgi:hypothetical protein
MFGFLKPKTSIMTIMTALMSYQALHCLVAVLLHPLTLALLTALVVFFRTYILRGFATGLAMFLKWLLRKLFWTLVSCCLLAFLWWLVQTWMWCSFQQWWLIPGSWMWWFLQSLSWLFVPPEASLDVSTCMQNAARDALSALCGRLSAMW